MLKKSSKSFLRNTKKNSARCQRVRCIACLLCTFCDKGRKRFDQESFNRVTKMSLIQILAPICQWKVDREAKFYADLDQCVCQKVT